MTEHIYGWKKEKYDNRDFKSTLPKIFPLPEIVDNRKYCSPVRNQDMLGSCTGFSIATGMREYLLNKRSISFVELSPLFVYYYERVIENSVGVDAGAFIRDGFKVLNKQGVCSEKLHPYNISKFREAPSSIANNAASEFRITSYHRLLNLNDIKSHIAQGHGISFGFTVRESFESLAVAKTGFMPMPKWHEKKLGGHAVFCCGYKNDITIAGGGYLIIKNSWGKEWGDQGYFYMPYAYVGNFFFSSNVNDIWTAE